MGRLDDVTIDELHEELAHTEGNKATHRVLAAI